MIRPFPSQETRPVSGGGEAFAVGGVEAQRHWETTFAEGGMFCEGEAFLELHLGLGRVVDVADFDRAAVGPWKTEGHELIEPTDLAFVEMLIEGWHEHGGLGFFDHRESLEGAGETRDDGGFVEGGELELGQGGVDEVHAGDELFQPMIHQRQVEGPGAVGFGEAASAGDGIEVALLGLLLDDEIAIARELHGGDALVLGIE